MVAPPKPRKVQMNGKQTFWLVPAIANIMVPKATEINAATGINLSCSLLKTFDGLKPEFGKVTLPEYLCEVDQFEGNDTTKWSMSELAGAFDPQAVAASDDKKAFEFLRNGFNGFAVFRNAKLANVTNPDAVVGEFVNVAPVSVTPSADTSSAADSSSIATWGAGVSVTGSIAMNVAVAA